MYIYIFFCVMAHFVTGETICDNALYHNTTDLKVDSNNTNHNLKSDISLTDTQRTMNSSSPCLDATRLMGGQNVSIRAFPYQAALYRETPRFKGFSGGAIIVSSKYLLTAAHCVGGRVGEYSVMTGQSVIPNHFDEHILNGNTYKFIEITIHPLYDVSKIPTNADNDIAVLKVDGELRLNGITSRAIELSFLPPPPGIMAQVSGFGNISKIADHHLLNIKVEEFQRHLKAAPVPTVAQDSCLKYFADFDSFFHITENMICVGHPCNHVACEVKPPPTYGDSGGSLVIDNKLIGISSFGWGCGSYDPAVYTAIYKYQGFITRLTNGTLDV